jgi:urease accessory protein
VNTDKTTTINEISLLQLSDSFFPTGSYTTSNGLEALFYKKRIKNPNELRDLIQVYLEQQIGPADCTALGNSYKYIQRSDLPKMLEVDQTLFSMKLVKEIRDASCRAGTQLLKCLNSFITNSKLLDLYLEAINKRQASGVCPVALAIASKTLNIPKNKTGLMMLYSFSVSVVGAGLRLGLVQHFEGQRIIHELKPIILEVVKSNIDRPLESMWQFVPDIDIIQIQHERMSSKMFIT